MTDDHPRQGHQRGPARRHGGRPKVIVMGEDVGKLGGVFRVTDGLQKDFGEDRVIDTPLAESGILGTAVGLAHARLPAGLRDPVRRVRLSRRTTRSSARSPRCTSAVAGRITMPIVIRIPFGGGIGAVEHHSESPEALLRAHRRPQGRGVLQPGRRLLDDPAGDRLRRPDRVLRAEAPLLGEGRARRVEPRPSRCSPRGSSREGTDADAARLRPDGEDLPARPPRPPARRARARGHRPAHAVAARPGAGARVGPQDRARRRRARGADHARPRARRSRRGSPRSASTRLEAPVLRVGGFDTPYPPSRIEEEYLPDLDRVLDAVDRALAY